MIVLLLFILLLPNSVLAATYYVSTTGSNSNDGLSESTPFLTMQKCVDVMVAGDTCNVGGGTYNATGVQFGVSGTAGSPITLQASPGATPVLSCTSSTNDDAHAMLFKNSTGFRNPIGWINVSGIEITNCYNGIKFTNLHDSIISNMHLHGNANQGILGVGGARVSILQSLIHENGPLGASTSNLEHGVYIVGNAITIRRNVIYGNQAYGIQLDGNKTYTAGGNYSSAEFATSANWIIESNTIAYNKTRAGIVVWGSNGDGARIENNIFYENATTLGSGEAQGINCTSCTGSTGLIVKNNHFYASGSGGQVGPHASLVGTISGNVTNVSAPAFVDGGSNSLPASPNFSLTASAPVNIAIANEFSNNSTNVVGAYKTIGTCSAAITANKITVTCPMSTSTPIHNLSNSGVSVGCTGSSCPASHSVSSVSRPSGALTQVEVAISGISGNACVSTNQNWALSYDSGLGTWSGNDNIGAYPGSHQKLFSFTSLSVTNNCTGSGPTAYPSGYHIYYKFDEGSGINANDESANSLDGTLTNGPTWGTGKTGSGVVITGNNTEHVAIPYGNGVNPSTQSLTIAFGINIPSGAESLDRQFFGSPLGTNRLYISTKDGTWRLGIQSSSDATAGDIAVTSGWHNVCLVMDSGTDTATLSIDGVASTAAGAVKSYTSYTLAGDFDLGRIADIATGGGGGTYDDLLIYTSVKDCAAIYSAFNAAAIPGGTFAQAAIQFQGVILDTAGSPIVVGPSVQSIEVPAGGGAVLLFQIHCQNISDCSQTAFKLVYAKNGSGVWQQVPSIETVGGTWMWGTTAEININNGIRSTRLTGSCTVTTGTTQLTSAQSPSVDLPQDGCTVMAYIVRVGSTQAGNYFDYKVQFESGADFPVYTQTARIRVVNPMASGIGF